MQSETNQSKLTQLHLPSLIQFICSMLAALTMIGIAITIDISAISQVLLPTNQPKDPLPSLLMAAGLFLVGCLLIPSAIYALARLVGWCLPGWKNIPKLISPIFWILAFPLVLEAGILLSNHKTLSWLFLPVLHILAIGIPVAWLTHIGCRRLGIGSDQRFWGSFGSGLVLAPVLIIIAEIAALLIFILITMVAIASSPGLSGSLRQITQQIKNLSQDPNAILQALSPILSQSWFFILVLAYGALLVPIIEELIKPMGVWLLYGRSLTPIEGFIAGVLSGAGYSLFESLALSSNAGEWSTIVTARISTGIIHITTTALSGWAIVSAWRYKRYFQLGIMYLLVVAIHGLWNGLLINAALTSLPFVNISAPTFNLALSVSRAVPLALVVLMAGNFLILIFSNRALQRSQQPSTVSGKNLG